MKTRSLPDGTRGITLSLFVHYESDGSILHAATTTPPPGEVQPGDVVVRQEVWIADRPNAGAFVGVLLPLDTWLGDTDGVDWE